MQLFRIIISSLFFIASLTSVFNYTIKAETERASIDSSEEVWEENIVAPADLKAALSEAKIESIPSTGAADIYMRVFGKNGKKHR